MPDTPYFTVEEFRARYPDLDDPPWTDAKIETSRELAEQAFEDAAGRAFVPRTATDRLGIKARLDGSRRLARRDVRELTSATNVDGDAVDVDGALLTDGWLRVTTGWPTGVVTVTYTYGLDEPPLRVKQAVMVLARYWMLKGPIDDRNTQLAIEGGGAINLATPGVFGSLFGLPEVDVCVQIYGGRAVALA
jgi:hypothetical protein